MLRGLMDKVGNMQEHMGNISKEMENLWKNQSEMVEEKKKNYNRNEEWLWRAF